MINYEIMLVANNQHLESYNLPSACRIACAVHAISSATTSFPLEGFYVHYSFLIPFYKAENSAILSPAQVQTVSAGHNVRSFFVKALFTVSHHTGTFVPP